MPLTIHSTSGLSGWSANIDCHAPACNGMHISFAFSSNLQHPGVDLFSSSCTCQLVPLATEKAPILIPILS